QAASATMASVFDTPSSKLEALGTCVAGPATKALVNSWATSMTTLPDPPDSANTSPPRCEKTTRVVGALAVFDPPMVMVAGAYGVGEVSSRVQLAPGATVTQSLSSTTTLGAAALLVTVMPVALIALPASLV